MRSKIRISVLSLFCSISFISLPAVSQLAGKHCFSSESEYKELNSSNKLPKIMQTLPLFLTGVSVFSKAVINIYFDAGVVKFYVKADTILGKVTVTPTSENRAKVCVEDNKISVSFPVGEAKVATILSDNKVKIQGLELAVVTKAEYTKLHNSLSEPPSDTMRSNNSPAGASQQ